MGFVLGFLAGAGIAAFYSLTEKAEAPGAEGGEPRTGTQGLLDKIKAKARSARQAGEAASREKQNAMMRDYEDAVHRHD